MLNVADVAIIAIGFFTKNEKEKQIWKKVINWMRYEYIRIYHFTEFVWESKKKSRIFLYSHFHYLKEIRNRNRKNVSFTCGKKNWKSKTDLVMRVKFDGNVISIVQMLTLQIFFPFCNGEWIEMSSLILYRYLSVENVRVSSFILL